MRIRSHKSKLKKAKKLAYRLIERESAAGKTLYAMLESLVETHHPELSEARIALAWNLTWKPDVDGRVTLGKCKKASDLDRELAAYDFVIILRQEFFEDLRVTDAHRRALIDHELCHAAVAHEEDGEPKYDERGRLVYRIRKHDIEEFADIVDRHGCWKKDLEAFAAAIERSRAKAKGFIGYTGLRDRLIAAGATVPLDTVTSWNADQRRDADIWARVALELGKKYPDGSVTTPPPEFVREGALNELAPAHPALADATTH